MRTILCFVISVICCAQSADASPSIVKPTRVVSTNVCADQLLMALADHKHIISVSRLAAEKEISNFAEAARAFPANSARAEEIVQLKPDLILGDIYTGKAANNLAQSIGVPVQFVDVANSLSDVRTIIRKTASVLHEQARGEDLIREMDNRIARASSRTARSATALVYEPNGMTSGTGTLTDDVLSAAGLRNLASTLTGSAYGTVPLEQVVLTAPQMLILDDSYSGSSSRAQSVLRHPAFLSLKDRTRIYRIPSRLWLCPGPWVAEAVERLAAEASALNLAQGLKQE